MVVISAPGGTTDIMSRLLAQAMGEGLGQQVVIDNRPGGGGLISAEIVAGAVPDGHTVLYTHTSFSVMPSLHKTLPYDTVKSFERVSVFALFPGVLLVNNNLPVKNVQELIAYAKARPGKLNFSSSGIGNPLHLAGELFNKMAGVEIVHVPYKGAAQQTADVAAKHITMTFASVAVVQPFISGGQVKPIAVTSKTRVAALPNVPPVSDAPGMAGYQLVNWYGLFAPAGTPADVMTKLNTEVTKVLRTPTRRARSRCSR
jgi:tripartite-type tricarboxylate transporter receptor subunit TctC